jgi:hypothetical protein
LQENPDQLMQESIGKAATSIGRASPTAYLSAAVVRRTAPSQPMLRGDRE